MSTVGNIALTAAAAALLSWGAPSAHANKLTEPPAPKASKSKRVDKRAKKTAAEARKTAAEARKTAAGVRAEQLGAVLDPDLGFGLATAAEAGPELVIKTRTRRTKKSKRAAKKQARALAKRHKRAMAKAMSVELGGRAKMVRTRAEEMMILEEQNLSDAAVKSSIRANRDSVDVCIERAAVGGKGPTGHANVSFTVEPLGHVTSVRVWAEGARAKRLSRCMKRAIKRWKFPSSDAATEVEFPLVLDIAGTAMERQ